MWSAYTRYVSCCGRFLSGRETKSCWVACSRPACGCQRKSTQQVASEEQEEDYRW